MTEAIASTRKAAGHIFSLDSRTVMLFMPHRHGMALLDRVEECCLEENWLIAIKNVARNDPVLAGHFPDYAIFPGTLIIEAMAQAAGCLMNLLYMRERGMDLEKITREGYVRSIPQPPLTVLAESNVVQTGLAFPGESIRLAARVLLRRGDLWSFTVESSAPGRRIAHGEVILGYPRYVPGAGISGVIQTEVSNVAD